MRSNSEATFNLESLPRNPNINPRNGVANKKTSIQERFLHKERWCWLVSISGREKIGCFINFIAWNSFFCSYDTRSFFKISFLLLVGNVQLYASNGQDWIRMLGMWSPESDGEHFYSKPRVVTFFFVPLPMSIFLPTEFQISLMILMSINFWKASS